MFPKQAHESWKALKCWGLLDEVFPKTKSPKRLPVNSNIFKAFEQPLDHVRVIVIGKSPYLDPKDNPTGIAFAIPDQDARFKDYPPSLKVLSKGLYEEYKDLWEQNVTMENLDVYFDPSLSVWVAEGFLMLNYALTTTQFNSDAHIKFWKPFTEQLIKDLDEYHEKNEGLIFYLLGSEAKSLERFINPLKHIVLKDHHPAYYSRKKEEMPTQFKLINKCYYDRYGRGIDYILPF